MPPSTTRITIIIVIFNKYLLSTKFLVVGLGTAAAVKIKKITSNYKNKVREKND